MAMSKVNILLMFFLLLGSVCFCFAISGQASAPQSSSVIISGMRSSGVMSSRLQLDGGNSSGTGDDPPCDLTVNACMDWCGETVRRPGFCADNQMCCLLIY